ncbi:hypothetical protein KJ865_09935, partial [Myxococcota bacterium]|nr:hypothetical protein [Myxococcota bacterium]
DCGSLAYYGEPEPFEPDGGYRREMKCEDLADGNGPVCAPVEVKWKPDASGDCKVIFAVWDLFGGTTWLEQRVTVQGL